MTQPLCFVLMPFGVKPDPLGGPDLDFDEIYVQALKPGIQDAGMCVAPLADSSSSCAGSRWRRRPSTARSSSC
jgi:hypothetical protein